MTGQTIELTRAVVRTLSYVISVRFSTACRLIGSLPYSFDHWPTFCCAQINYGSHMGTHVTYVNVTEDSGEDEPLPLFGAPTVTGNSIDFNPVEMVHRTRGHGAPLEDSVRPDC